MKVTAFILSLLLSLPLAGEEVRVNTYGQETVKLAARTVLFRDGGVTCSVEEAGLVVNDVWRVLLDTETDGKSDFFVCRWGVCDCLALSLGQLYSIEWVQIDGNFTKYVLGATPVP